MVVTRLGCQNFRNLRDGELFPCPGVNVIYGGNAQGKTNLLEGLWLFTGKVGWLCRNGMTYAVQLLLTLAGNFAGTLCVALLLRQTRAADGLVQRSAELSAAKMADSLPSLFVLALLCGVLMYLGVSGFQAFDSALGRYGAVFLAVTVFILSGFEHCIANMYYYSMSGVWGDGRAWLTMLVMVLGNAAGSIIIAEGYRLSQKLLE